MRLYTAPEEVGGISERASIFLAGSIEMGKAEDWQLRAIDAVRELQVAVFNPRRKEWDPTWEQSINNPNFAEQVNWELDQLSRCDVAFFYFQPGTMSPITLMELGYVLGRDDHRDTIVVCPEGFWRKGNIEVMVDRAQNHPWHQSEGLVYLFDNFEEGLEQLIESAEHALTVW